MFRYAINWWATATIDSLPKSKLNTFFAFLHTGFVSSLCKQAKLILINDIITVHIIEEQLIKNILLKKNTCPTVRT